MRFALLATCGLLLIVGVAGAAPTSLYWWMEAESFSGLGYGGDLGSANTWRVGSPIEQTARDLGGFSGDACATLEASAASAEPLVRKLNVPRAGVHRLWVRYVDWSDRAEPFSARISGKNAVLLDRVFGTAPVAAASSDAALLCGFDLAWDCADVRLPLGESTLQIVAAGLGEPPRHIDVLILTDDLQYRPVGRERPVSAAALYLDGLRSGWPALRPWLTAAPAPVPPQGWRTAAPDRCELSWAVKRGGDTEAAEKQGSTTVLRPDLSDTALRIAFARGSARQSGGAWSASFASLFAPRTPAALRDASCSWLRKSLFYAYFGGASRLYVPTDPAAFPEQERPFIEVAREFGEFVQAHPDRGVPLTPVAILLDPRHQWWGSRDGTVSQRAISALFNVVDFPRGVVQGEWATADRQSFVSGMFGDVFDVLVASRGENRAIEDYSVVILAGELALDREWLGQLSAFVESGGALLLNAAHAGQFDRTFLGLKLGRGMQTASELVPKVPGERIASAPFEVRSASLTTGEALAVTPEDRPLVVRNLVGRGQVITLLVPHGTCFDGQPAPALAFAVAHLLASVAPIQVRGEVEWLLNRTAGGWLVVLLNNRGVYQYPDGRLHVDRRETAEVSLICPWTVERAKEWTTEVPVEFRAAQGGLRIAQVTVPAGGVAVIEITPESAQ